MDARLTVGVGHVKVSLGSSFGLVPLPVGIAMRFVVDLSRYNKLLPMYELGG